MSFRISIAQQPLAWQDAAANRAHFEALLAPLAGTTDLVILPEMFTTGFTMKPEQFAEDAGGATRAWLLAQASALDAAVGGSVAVNDEGRYFNRFMLALPGGPTYWYDKRHLFRMAGEHRHYEGGSHALIIEWRGLRLCPLVCYDLRFPVWSRRRRHVRRMVDQGRLLHDSRIKASASSCAGNLSRQARRASRSSGTVTTWGESLSSTRGWPVKSSTTLSPTCAMPLPSSPTRFTPATNAWFSMARARSSVVHARRRAAGQLAE